MRRNHSRFGLFSEEAYFLKKMIDLWEIKKTTAVKNPGLLPADSKIRDKIVNYLFDWGVLGAKRVLWADVTTKRSPINFNCYDFVDINEFQESYIDTKLMATDPMLKAGEMFKNTTLLKYTDFSVSEYRASPLYKRAVKPQGVEDSCVSNVYNKETGVTTYFGTYRSDLSERLFFREDDRERQDFIVTFLSFNPLYPIAFCSGKGELDYDDNGFFELCEREFPHIKNQSKLPSPWLARLVTWNQDEQKKITSGNIKFKVTSYTGMDLHIIQAIPEIFSEKNNVFKIEAPILENKSYVNDNIFIFPNEYKPYKSRYTVKNKETLESHVVLGNIVDFPNSLELEKELSAKNKKSIFHEKVRSKRNIFSESRSLKSKIFSPDKSLFLQKIIGLWQIRKKDTAYNPGLLPANAEIRDKIIRHLLGENLIKADIALWTDGDERSRLPINYNNYGFFDFENFMKDVYIGEGYIYIDPLIKISENNKNNTFIKSKTIDMGEYRKSPFYGIANSNVEDTSLSNVYDEKRRVMSFLSFYRTNPNEKFFFTEDDRERQDFIITLLSFDPLYPIVFCDKDGRLEYEDNGFFEQCEREFPGISVQQKLPSPWLAQLIKWNKNKKKIISYKFNTFKVSSYNELYAIQAVPKIFNYDTLLKEEDNSEISPGEASALQDIERYYKKSGNLKSNIAYINRNFSQKTNNDVKYPDNHKNKEEMLDESLPTTEEIIKLLQTDIEEKDQIIAQLKQRNTHLEQQVSGYQSSVTQITENPALPKPVVLTPPEVAPALFEGKQGQALEFLKEHYSQYLTCFGAEQDTLFQYQLKKLDKRLYTALAARINYLRKSGHDTPTFAEIVPPKKQETDQLIGSTPSRIRSLSNVINQRRHKSP